MLSHLKISNALLTPMQMLSYLLRSSFMIIFLACVFITWEIDAAVFYKTYFTSFDLTKTACMIFYVAYTFVCFALLPYLYVRFFLKDSLSDLAVRWPDNRLSAWILFFGSLPITMACLIWLAKLPSFQTYYGFGHHVSWIRFIIIQCTLLPSYYFPEEFFFRGFLFLTLYKRIGWHSLWITELLFTVAHIAKPPFEILFAIPVGIVLNLLTLWTRSIIPAIVYHCCIGIALNFLVFSFG